MATGSIVAAVDVAFPLVTRQIVDDLGAGIAPNLAFYGAIFAVLTLTLCAGVKGFIELGGRIRTRVAHDIRRDAFRNLQELSFSFFDKRPVGWLMARMTSDCERLSNIMAWGLLDLAWGTTLMSGTAVVLFTLDASLAAVTLAVIPVLAWISVLFQRRILKSSRVVRKTNSRLTASYNEGITGMRTTKIFVREDDNLAEFQELSGEMQAASVRNQLQSALYLPIVLTLGSLATGMALAYGGFGVLEGGISLGTLIAFLALGAHFFQPVQELAHWFAEMQMAQASAERVLGLIEEVPEVRDSPEVRAQLAAGAASTDTHGKRAVQDAVLALAADGYPDALSTLEFRGVGFAYTSMGSGTDSGATGSGAMEVDENPTAAPELKTPVLEDFNLTVHSGETVALVGSTGSGKSTIVNLLCRFYEPTSGEILIDGVDYRKRSLHWLQSQLGIVLQTPHLFSGTIRDNIRYGRLDASDEDVEEAARIAGADEFIARMDTGLRHGGRRGRNASLGRPEAAGLLRSSHPRETPRAGDGRGHFVSGHPHGAANPGRPGACPRRPHELRHRAPTLDHSLGRSDPGDRKGKDRRAGKPPRTARRARPLLRPLHPTEPAGIRTRLRCVVPGKLPIARVSGGTRHLIR